MNWRAWLGYAVIFLAACAVGMAVAAFGRPAASAALIVAVSVRWGPAGYR